MIVFSENQCLPRKALADFFSISALSASPQGAVAHHATTRSFIVKSVVPHVHERRDRGATQMHSTNLTTQHQRRGAWDVMTQMSGYQAPGYSPRHLSGIGCP
eukprot:1541763-Rhodomonas_salina.4